MWLIFKGNCTRKPCFEAFQWEIGSYWKQIFLTNVSDKYAAYAYRGDFIETWTKFQSMRDGHLGRINVGKHRIELLIDNTQAIQPAFYRPGLKTREFEKPEIQKMLPQNSIESSQTERTEPFVIAHKKNGKLRFCVDYRKLNAETKKDSYPRSHIDEYFDSVGKATVCSTLGAVGGYWQVEIDKLDREITAFKCHYGLYSFIRKHFGLRKAPDNFQCTTDDILLVVKWQFAFV